MNNQTTSQSSCRDVNVFGHLQNILACQVTSPMPASHNQWHPAACPAPIPGVTCRRNHSDHLDHLSCYCLVVSKPDFWQGHRPPASHVSLSINRRPVLCHVRILDHSLTSRMPRMNRSSDHTLQDILGTNKTPQPVGCARVEQH